MTTSRSSLAVVLTSTASEIELYAATELQRYVMRLYKVSAAITRNAELTADRYILIGTTTEDGSLHGVEGLNSRSLGEQGFLLRTISYRGVTGILIAARQPRAVLWGAYRLIEELGVRFLTTEDVYPAASPEADPVPAVLPRIDRVFNPVFKDRVWRGINVFAMGPESWGLTEYRAHLDQLAKLKFNTYVLNMFTHHPFVDYDLAGRPGAGAVESRGRQRSDILHGWRMPLEEPFVGREIFGGEREFWNREFLGTERFQDRCAAAQRLAHGIMEHARLRGFETVITVSLTEVPRELRTPENAYPDWRWGTTPDTSNPVVMDNVCTILKSYVDTYPEVDYLMLSVSEFRQSNLASEECWRKLDERYGISTIMSYDEVLAAARSRSHYPGGVERVVTEVKADIETLFFLDRLLADRRPFDRTARPDMKIIVCNLAPELSPVLPRVLPPGTKLHLSFHYTAYGTAMQSDDFKTVSDTMEAVCWISPQDDNIGVVTQIDTTSIHRTLDTMRGLPAWTGYLVRLWIARDVEPTIAYIARASWDREETPESSYRDHYAALCGTDAADRTSAVFAKLEEVTQIMEQHFIGIGFPVPENALVRAFRTHESPDPRLLETARTYAGCAQMLKSIASTLDRTTHAAGIRYLRYFAARAHFSAHYLTALHNVALAGLADERADGQAPASIVNRAQLETSNARATDWQELTRDRYECHRLLREAYDLLRDAIQRTAETTIPDARGLGLIATLNEFFYKPLFCLMHTAKMKMDEEQGNAGV